MAGADGEGNAEEVKASFATRTGKLRGGENEKARKKGDE
jgi:hypothetical protein